MTKSTLELLTMPSPATLQQAIRDALSADPVDWNYRPAPHQVCCTRCCVCGDCVRLGTPGEVCFDSTATLPIHKECHRTKEGMSSAACRLSHAFGFRFLVDFAQKDTKKRPVWTADFFKEFIDSEGPTAGERLIGHGVEWWERSDGFTDLPQFTRWVRYAYMFEREAPKFTFRGSQVPQWDEKMDWTDYKYQRKKGSKRPDGPFYAALPPGKRTGTTPKCDCKVLARTAGLCGICREPIDADASKDSVYSCNADHIFPDSKGGSDDLVNIQAAHKFCNAGKTSISGGHAPLGWMLGRFALHVMKEDDATDRWKSLYVKACDRVKGLL